MATPAIMIDELGKSESWVFADPQQEFHKVVQRPLTFTPGTEDADLSAPLILPIQTFERLGTLPSGTLVYGAKKAGLSMWEMDQWFKGPERNTLPLWQRVTTEQDQELLIRVRQLAGCYHWPNVPARPPFVQVWGEMRFVDAPGPYQFLYHRKTFGVSPKRVM